MKSKDIARDREPSNEAKELSADGGWVVYHRLQLAREALERHASPDTKKVLEARAEALAQPVGNESDGESLEVLEFQVGNESYGIETTYICEVCPLKELTPLPSLPPFVLGIISVRGRIVSVLDIKRFFDLPAAGLTNSNKVIVLREEGMEIGLLADSIGAVRHVAPHELQPSLATLTGIRADYLRGVTPERLVILDAIQMLSDRRIVVNQQWDIGHGTEKEFL